MNLKARLTAAARSLSVWIYGLMLLAVQYTDDITQGVSDYLPALAKYLPPNVYEAVGVAVVIFNILHAAHKAHQLAQAKGDAHG